MSKRKAEARLLEAQAAYGRESIQHERYLADAQHLESELAKVQRMLVLSGNRKGLAAKELLDAEEAVNELGGRP